MIPLRASRRVRFVILFICLILYCKIGVAVKIVITIHKFCTLNDMNGLSFRIFLTDGKVNRLLIKMVSFYTSNLIPWASGR